MKPCLLLFSVIIAASGCATRPSNTAAGRLEQTEELAQDQFVARRAAESQQPGGTFSEPGNTESQPQEAARGRFDKVAEDVSPPPSTPTTSSDKAEQDDIEETLEDIDRAQKQSR